MVIGIATLELSIPVNDSLKGKRSVVKPLIARLRREFNVSVAEVDLLDSHRAAIIGVACVSNDKAYAHGLLMKVVDHVERWRIDAELVDYEIELIE
ncbi:MAG: DUF503 domain-containing protein [Anaerolineae bacterium]|nr:DUF503 domain-containing protein [Anaerolineae bacterium]MCB9133754.1 DUF503 domain-containing protein [Anaerolineales bacterium]MCB0229704.1 DUF503 domain-containing protein [Anaerolineae bacterium]MCB0236033.1 DUF503 domain-containing protein [Anaerolineae bacterium]MCB0242967.1 DUF503 domain-containing protein [Anaerolineae bacterium]